MNHKDLRMRKAYEKQLEVQLRVWNAEIERLIARADRGRADTKIRYYAQVDSLREKGARAYQKLLEMKRLTGKAWEEMRTRVEAHWIELGQSITEMASR